MKKLLLLLTILLVLFGCSSPELGVVKPAEVNNSIFWKAYNNDTVIYLLGSIHAGDKSFYPLPAHIYQAFEQSDILAVELDAITAQSKAATEMAKLAMLPKGKTLEDMLSKDDYKLVAEGLKKIGMNIELMKGLKPWAIAMTVQMMQAMKLGLNPSLGIDFHFLTKAHKTKKQIDELEGATYQINLFNAFSDKVQKDFLLESIKQLDEENTDLAKLSNAWKSGDDATINSVLNKAANDPKGKELYKKLLTDRNYEMSEKIENYFKNSKKVFVVVGAGHLVGKEGIIEILAKKGFTIKRL